MTGKWGIVVAVGANALDGVDSKRGTGGMPVLLALANVWRVFGCSPYLYLVDPLGAKAYTWQEDEDGKSGRYIVGRNRPSTAAAGELRAQCAKDRDISLLLVHLDLPTRFLHPGLLPWLARFAPEHVPTAENVVPLDRLVTKCLTAAERPKVMIAVMTPKDLKCEDAQWLTLSWQRMMNDLDHQNTQKQPDGLPC